MVIQRIQTLFLLLALGMLIAFLFIPFGFWDAEILKSNPEIFKLTAGRNAALLLPTALTIVLVVCSIFLFKKLPLQKSLVSLSAILVVAMMLVVVYVMTLGFNIANPDVTVRPIWGSGGLLLVGALIALIFAVRGIASDQKLLRSYDRLR